MAQTKQTPKQDRAESVGWSDLSENDLPEGHDRQTLDSGESGPAREDECLASNSKRLKASLEELSTSLEAFSEAMQKTIR